MEQKVQSAKGPYRLVRTLRSNQLWNEHLAVFETASGRGELCRLLFLNEGVVEDEPTSANKLTSLLALRDENLDRVIDVGTSDRGLYVAFEYSPGRTLEQIVTAMKVEGGAVPVSACLYLGVETLKGLKALRSDWGEGEIYHGFIGPQSIFVSTRGDASLLYQGLAAGCGWDLERLNAVFEVEQNELSHAEDVRAVALLLKELLFPSGAGAFKTSPEMPAGLARIIARALSPAPQMCFKDAEAMLGELVKLQSKLWEVCTAIQMSELIQQLFGDELDREAEEAAELTGAKTPPLPQAISLARLDRSIPLGSLIDGRYRLIREIGQGAAGIVFEAEHIELKTQVAIKMLDRDYCQDVTRVERFRREARASSKIGHPNIIRVSDLGQTKDGRFYYVMEYAEGETLADLIRRVGFLDEKRIAPIMIQVCDALDAAHETGIVHRDLKPENILLTRDSKGREHARVADFGLSLNIESNEQRLTREGQAVGTPYFMAPEQVRGEPTDARTDVYASGVILYEAVTGTPMFDYQTVAETLTAHLHDAPEPIGERTPTNLISRSFEDVIMKAVAKDPLDRFQNMKEMGHALEVALARCDDELNAKVRRVPPPPPPPPPQALPNPAAAEDPPIELDSADLMEQPRPWFRQTSRLLALGAILVIAMSATIVLWPRGGTNVASATGGTPLGNPPVAADAGGRSDSGSNAAIVGQNNTTSTADAAGIARDAAARADSGELATDAGPSKTASANDGGRSSESGNGDEEDQGPSARELVKEGMALSRSGQLGQAERLCKQALRLSSSYAPAWVCIGQTQVRRGNHAQAVTSFKRAVSLRSRNVQYRLLLAGALRSAGRTGEAAHEYDAVLVIDPDNPIAKRMRKR